MRVLALPWEYTSRSLFHQNGNVTSKKLFSIQALRDTKIQGKRLGWAGRDVCSTIAWKTSFLDFSVSVPALGSLSNDRISSIGTCVKPGPLRVSCSSRQLCVGHSIPWCWYEYAILSDSNSPFGPTDPCDSPIKRFARNGDVQRLQIRYHHPLSDKNGVWKEFYEAKWNLTSVYGTKIVSFERMWSPYCSVLSEKKMTLRCRLCM